MPYLGQVILARFRMFCASITSGNSWAMVLRNCSAIAREGLKFTVVSPTLADLGRCQWRTPAMSSRRRVAFVEKKGSHNPRRIRPGHAGNRRLPPRGAPARLRRLLAGKCPRSGTRSGIVAGRILPSGRWDDSCWTRCGDHCVIYR